MKHLAKLLLLLLILKTCSGCSSTKFIAENVTYDETWDASLKVIQNHHFFETSKKTFAGIPTFETKIDHSAGIINVAKTYPPLGDRITKLQIHSQSELEQTVTIRSMEHSMFYIGPSRDQKYEERLRDQILHNLHQRRLK